MLPMLILDSLREAGHQGELADDRVKVDRALASKAFDAAIVDLDTRARNGVDLIQAIRARAPSTTVIALLPCGGLRPGKEALSVANPVSAN